MTRGRRSWLSLQRMKLPFTRLAGFDRRTEPPCTQDREFLLVNPLDCTRLAGDDVMRCEAETTAFKACEPKPGREFMRCVRDALKAGPTGAP
jgi:hypothetical protein